MPDLRRLTEAHRKAQVQLGAETVALMVAAFQIIDPADINGTVPRWLAVAHPIIQSQRARSTSLASAYLTAARNLALGPLADGFTPVLAFPAPAEQISTSLLVTGAYSLRRNLSRLMPEARAVDIAKAGSAGAAMRLVLNGGRETITETIKADARARGYERVTSGNPCDFCSMLADRGAVYGEESADFEAHDHCSCSAEPVFA